MTKKFIGDYDPNLEKMYTYQVSMESETVNFEILDTAGYVQDVSKNYITIIALHRQYNLFLYRKPTRNHAIWK